MPTRAAVRGIHRDQLYAGLRPPMTVLAITLAVFFPAALALLTWRTLAEGVRAGLGE